MLRQKVKVPFNNNKGIPTFEILSIGAMPSMNGIHAPIRTTQTYIRDVSTTPDKPGYPLVLSIGSSPLLRIGNDMARRIDLRVRIAAWSPEVRKRTLAIESELEPVEQIPPDNPTYQQNPTITPECVPRMGHRRKFADYLPQQLLLDIGSQMSRTSILLLQPSRNLVW